MSLHFSIYFYNINSIFEFGFLFVLLSFKFYFDIVKNQILYDFRLLKMKFKNIKFLRPNMDIIYIYYFLF